MIVTEVFFDVNMSNGHSGLTDILKQAKVKLGKNRCAVFINTSKTALKMLTPDNVLLHLRQPSNRPIEMEAIKHLPYCVGGNELSYNKALESALLSKLNRAKR